MNEARADFPDLSGTEATRDTLHAYSRVLEALRRAHAPPHERWWHVSLRLGPRGLAMPPTPRPDRPDSTFSADMNLVDHRLEVQVEDESVARIDLLEGMSGSALGDRVVHLLGAAGVDVAPERERYEDEGSRTYDPTHATAWLTALHGAECALGTVRDDMSGERGPIQLWPHHFDLAFERFGTRLVTFVEDGEEQEATSQVGCGFSPFPSAMGGEWPYFYATPWPFDDSYSKHVLPCEAAWVTEGWQGALLPYEEVRARGQDAVAEFCLAVYELTRSSLD